MVEVEAANPCSGLIDVRPWPIVRMMRQPPEAVPIPMARPAATTTQICGPVPEAWKLLVISTSVMMPIVFWPSEVPWASATSDDENA